MTYDYSCLMVDKDFQNHKLVPVQYRYSYANGNEVIWI